MKMQVPEMFTYFKYIFKAITSWRYLFMLDLFQTTHIFSLLSTVQICDNSLSSLCNPLSLSRNFLKIQCLWHQLKDAVIVTWVGHVCAMKSDSWLQVNRYYQIRDFLTVEERVAEAVCDLHQSTKNIWKQHLTPVKKAMLPLWVSHILSLINNI